MRAFFDEELSTSPSLRAVCVNFSRKMFSAGGVLEPLWGALGALCVRHRDSADARDSSSVETTQASTGHTSSCSFYRWVASQVTKPYKVSTEQGQRVLIQARELGCMLGDDLLTEAGMLSVRHILGGAPLPLSRKLLVVLICNFRRCALFRSSLCRRLLSC